MRRCADAPMRRCADALVAASAIRMARRALPRTGGVCTAFGCAAFALVLISLYLFGAREPRGPTLPTLLQLTDGEIAGIVVATLIGVALLYADYKWQSVRRSLCRLQRSLCSSQSRAPAGKEQLSLAESVTI